MSSSTKQGSSQRGADPPQSMDKVKKILSSPLARRRNNMNNNMAAGSTQPPANQRAPPAAPSYFGVALETLVAKERVEVPKLVMKVCQYILANGLSSEGVFRVNGNGRIVDKLRAAFEQSGDADLDAVLDVMSVAGLLKLFLRELPEGVVPEDNTHRFVRAQQELQSDKAKCTAQLRILLKQLPPVSYSVLKYLCHFLVKVSLHEAENKMSPMALGIVFGPNIFRCSYGLEGLKDQGVTNYVTKTFIQDYDALFLKEGETSPYVKNGKKRPAPAPPRSAHQRSDAYNGAPAHPLASPRKHKLQRGGGEPGQEEQSGVSRSSDAHHTHNYSDDDLLENGRLSPFPLETDRSEYSLNTTSHSFTNVEVVDRVISSAVTEHLFGGELSSDLHATSEEEKELPVAPPRRKRQLGVQPHKIKIDDDSSSSNDSDNEMKLTVKQRIQQMEQDEQPQQPLTHAKPHKQRPASKAFQLFEKKGLVIGPAPDNLKKTLAYGGDGAEVAVESDDNESPDEHKAMTSPKPVPRTRQHVNNRKAESLETEKGELNSVPRTQTTLANFKKPAGPKNRRTPTRRSVKGADHPDEEAILSISKGEEEKENPEHSEDTRTHLDNSHPTTKPLHLHIPTTQHDPYPHAPSRGILSTELESNGSQLSPNMKFLDLPYNGTAGSPEKSPAEQRKPYVPPLDLSILHEHGDGSDPISIQHGQSVSLQKMQPSTNTSVAMVSPRSDKMHGQKSGEPDPDTALPPSPPMVQLDALRLQRVDEDYAQQIKQYTKKIQSCKRRIKQFEESFEAQQGYRPSQTDKAAKPDIKKCMQDLARARKELRRVKEEQQRAGTEPVVEEEPGGKTGAGSPSMRDSLHALMKRLAEKRREGNRPEDLSLMSWEQVQEEKLAVQKTLLHFESIHGRPSTKGEKELMRPLYDRYRNVKRMLAKGAPAPISQADLLQTVPEDTAIEFDTGSAKTTVSSRDPIRVPTAEPDDDEQNAFMVTRDMRLLRDTVVAKETIAGTGDDKVRILGTTTSTGGWMEDTGQIEPTMSPEKKNIKNLHEMTVSQLLDEQNRTREDKKRLRKLLREFEDEFQQVNGRKVQKEDRAPMNTEYQEYKQVKAKLKLMEALLSKHDASP